MKEIYKALAGFQYDVPIIHKGSKSYSYSYADIAEITEKIRPILKKHNLGYVQPLNGDIIKTVIYHTSSGETIKSKTKVPFELIKYVEVEKMGKDKKPYKANVILGFEGQNLAQAYGSLTTYFRRYALSSILGLVSDVDSDARNKRMDDEGQPLPELHPDNKKDWNNIVRVLATKQYTLKQVKTKWTIPEEHEERMNEDVKAYVPEVKIENK